MTQKTMSIRLSTEQAEQLETVASVEQLPVSEVIRAAITNHIESVSSQETFQAGLRARIERSKGLLR